MITDYDIMRALVAQVQRARRAGGPRVLTIISRPMWRAWQRAIGEPDYPGSELTTECRIYGSPVCVIEDHRLFSFTKCLRLPTPQTL